MALYISTTGYKAAKKQYKRLQNYDSLKNMKSTKVQILGELRMRGTTN